MTATHMRQALNKTLRGQLEKTVGQARALVEKAAREEIERLGVGESSAPSYLQPGDAKLRVQLRAHGRTLGDIKASDDSQQIDHLVDEVAYEHWHRMLFAYFLAQNDLLMCEGYPVTLAECEELAPELNARNGWEAAGMLAAQMLPQVFRASSPALQIVLPIDAVRQLEKLIVGLHPDTFQAQDALGWLYQFWQSERKKAVNDSGVKIGANELSPVTQLFTEPYMVSFLLDNALGAWWANRKLTQNDVTTTTTEAELRQAASAPGVPLQYLRFVKPEADQPPSENNAWTPAAGTFEQWPERLEDLTVIDPCCGSGHFLVAAFLMLVPLRMVDEDLSAKEAVNKVLSQNLHGLELDQRCVELAAFAIALEAWRYPDETGKPLGYRKLPELQLACSGTAIGAAKGEWKQLAKQIAAQAAEQTTDAAEQKNNLSIALDWLQQTFQHAPVLGSLINPRRSDAAKIVDWPTLQQALTHALDISSDETTFEAQVAAQGLTKAAQLLSKQYSWVITNVPYLNLESLEPFARKYCRDKFPRAKADLAIVFYERISDFLIDGGISSIVMPQSFLYKDYYSSYREYSFSRYQFGLIARLGAGAFSEITGEEVKAALVHGSNRFCGDNSHLLQIDCQNYPYELKAANLSSERLISMLQSKSLVTKRKVLKLDLMSDKLLLEDISIFSNGIQTGDYPRFGRASWELNANGEWHYQLTTVNRTDHFGGRTRLVKYGSLELHDFVREKLGSESTGAWLRGTGLSGKYGVAISATGDIKATLYRGELFDDNTVVILPKKGEDLNKIWATCSDDDYNSKVRQVDQSRKVRGALLRIGVSNSESETIPLPYTNDPIQWIFHGHPCGSVVWSEESRWTELGELRVDDTVLQVATVRLLGYRWPAELDPGMALATEQREWVNRCDELLGDLVDDDGIVCLPALRGEATAAHRLELMLEAAYGDAWSNSVREQLLASVGAKSLEVWLRDKFFEQHCKLFQHRPFIWQVWDGLKDGFSALVNYHRLDANNLDRLIYTYLNDWISQQAESVKQGVDGAEIRLSAAQALKSELEAIKHGKASDNGESGYDIFVRWKPLHEQPIGWEPDLNDGVRLNIRPFMTAKDVGKKGAGILRAKPNMHWTKDKGSDVASAPWYHLGLEYGGKEGDRINDHHLTRAEKQAAREAFAKAQAEKAKADGEQVVDSFALEGGSHA